MAKTGLTYPKICPENDLLALIVFSTQPQRNTEQNGLLISKKVQYFRRVKAKNYLSGNRAAYGPCHVGLV